MKAILATLVLGILVVTSANQMQHTNKKTEKKKVSKSTKKMEKKQETEAEKKARIEKLQ
jgi:L-fucose mutarotase/ribose pyranase (RbsD/FucU family)